MASERVETFLGRIGLWNAGRIDDLLDQLGPSFVFTPDPRFPEAGPVEGEALRRWFHEWTGMWDNNQLEVTEAFDRGEAVVAICRWHLTVPKSGLEVPQTEFTMVTWFEEGDVSSMQAFFEHDDALARADAGPP